MGLADALVAEPEVIILDEPTIGLDSNQSRDVRQLIKGLAGTHTVLISTHILPEAETTCNWMVIMFGGKILAAGAPGPCTADEPERHSGCAICWRRNGARI